MSGGPAAAPPAEQRASWQYIRATRANLIGRWRDIHYAEPIVAHRLLWRRTLVVSDPAAIQRVLVDEAGRYGKTVVNRRLLALALGEGLLTSEGETWRRRRRVLAPPFQPRALAAYAPAIAASVETLLARWDALPDGATIDLPLEARALTLDVIARVLFGAPGGTLAARIGDGIGEYQDSWGRVGLLDLLGAPPWVPRRGKRRARGSVRRLDAALAELGAAASMTATPAPLVATLREALGDEPGALRDELATLFLAGHETTGAALTWTFHLLSLHPEAEARLQAEADSGGEPAPFIRAVIDEAMRLYPPVPTIARTARVADTLAGHPVRPGTTVVISPWLVHRHRRLWRDPERFDPARFLPGAPERPRFAFMPFGGGPHVCLGAALATLELTTAIAAIARRYALRPASAAPVEPVGLITLWPRDGLRVTLARRDSPRVRAAR